MNDPACTGNQVPFPGRFLGPLPASRILRAFFATSQFFKMTKFVIWRPSLASPGSASPVLPNKQAAGHRQAIRCGNKNPRLAGVTGPATRLEQRSVKSERAAREILCAQWKLRSQELMVLRIERIPELPIEVQLTGSTTMFPVRGTVPVSVLISRSSLWSPVLSVVKIWLSHRQRGDDR